MLTLTRREGEEILIGSRVRLKVRKITPTRVELSIVAPDELRILRAERRHVATAALPAVQQAAG